MDIGSVGTDILGMKDLRPSEGRTAENRPVTDSTDSSSPASTRRKSEKGEFAKSLKAAAKTEPKKQVNGEARHESASASDADVATPIASPTKNAASQKSNSKSEQNVDVPSRPGPVVLEDKVALNVKEPNLLEKMQGPASVALPVGLTKALPMAEAAPVDVLTRRGAILKFMTQMQNEFEVSPLRMLNAFGQLSVEELGMPPRETIDKVVAELGLPKAQQPTAKKYFSEMLTKLDAQSMTDYLKSPSQQLSLESLSNKELRDVNLNKSIQSMQSAFFAQNVPRPVVVPAAQNLNIAVTQAEDLARPTTENMISNTGASQPTEYDQLEELLAPLVAMTAPLNETAEGLTANSADALKPAVAKPLAERIQDLKSAIAELDASFIAPIDSQSQAVVDSAKVLDVDAMATQMKMEAPTTAMATAVEAKPQTVAPTSQKGDAKSELDSKDRKSTSLDKAEAAQPVVDAGSFKLGKTELASGSAIAAGEIKTADRQENADAIAAKTQMMAAKGGGEIKMKLQPEGLGEVSIKVAVHEGKVNVQLTAESDHAKKMLEKGLADLKVSLHSQRLDVDQIHVEVGRDNMQDLMNQYQDAERRFAQNFMNQFRENNQQMREGMLNPAGSRVYKGQTAPSAVDPSVAKKSAADRRLDLVA